MIKGWDIDSVTVDALLEKWRTRLKDLSVARDAAPFALGSVAGASMTVLATCIEDLDGLCDDAIINRAEKEHKDDARPPMLSEWRPGNGESR